MKRRKNLFKKILIFIISLLFILFVSFYIYTLNYYKADDYSKELLNNENIIIDDNITIINANNNNNIGLIFYPGGKVEDISYLPLLNKISNRGITSFLVNMPFNLAVFNIDAATKIIEKYPEIDKWYLMGHSLGGAMASSYYNNNSSKIEGLILLAAYPLNDSIKNTLTIYGSNDLVLDQNKVKNVANAYKIEGGNHAFFGNYGNQKGDGIATISREEQQNITSSLVLNFIF